MKYTEWEQEEFFRHIKHGRGSKFGVCILFIESYKGLSHYGKQIWLWVYSVFGVLLHCVRGGKAEFDIKECGKVVVQAGRVRCVFCFCRFCFRSCRKAGAKSKKAGEVFVQVAKGAAWIVLTSHDFRERGLERSVSN
jgi:hypothetical protein